MPSVAPRAEPGRRRLLAGLLAAPLVLTGCDTRKTPDRRPGADLSVFWWGDARRAELTEKALTLYSQRHPGVRFRLTWQGDTGYYQRLATQAVGGNVPDLIQIDDDHLAEYAERQILLDLSESVRTNRLDLRGLPTGLLGSGRVAGQTVAVPAAAHTPALVYNRTLLRRLDVPEPTIGMSYPAFLTWATTVGQRSVNRTAGVVNPSGDHRALWLWLRARNKELYQGRSLGFLRSDLVEWFDLWREARGRSASTDRPVRSTGVDSVRQLLVGRRSASAYVWSSELPELQHYTDDELRLVSPPGDPATQWAQAPMYWAAFRGTRQPETVLDVLNFLTNDVDAGRILGVDRGLSANVGVRRTLERGVTDPAVLRCAAYETTMAGRVGPTPATPPRGHDQVRVALAAAADQVVQGRASSRNAATRFVQEAEAALTG